MSHPFDRCQSAMLGHALANHFQAATHMAIELSESLQKLKQFDETDVMSRYLTLREKSEYRMGEVVDKVYENLISNRTPSNQEDFRFPVSRISQAVQSAHEQLRGLSAGCNPAQRSYPLALCPQINDEKLFQISCTEAKLTHLHGQAGQVSGIINLILRRLIKGDSWDQAVAFAFKNAPSDLAGDIREIRERYTNDHLLSPYTDPAYAPNVLLATLYCVNRANSFEDAFADVNKIDDYYSPTLIGLLAGARWGIPDSILQNSHNEKIEVIKKLANRFQRAWVKQSKSDSHILQKVIFKINLLH